MATTRIWPIALVAALCGCPEEDGDDAPPTKTTTTTTSETPATATTPSASATLTPATAAPPPTTPGVEPRAKAELDGKADPAAAGGPTLTATGTKATFTTPSGWKTAKSGDIDTATSADAKSAFATVTFKGADPNAKRDAAAAALGLTACTWGVAEPIALGKDKLPANVADGACTRNGAPTKTVFTSIAGTDLDVVAVGTWDAPGGDANAVFSVFRTAKKAGAGGVDGIAACCAALSQNMANAPPEQKGFYAAALGVCNSVKSNPDARAALAQVRGALAAVGAPPACK
jgi:hypothetical protein